MIERKVEVKKGEVVKAIEESLEPIYLNMGWTKVEPKPEKRTTNTFKMGK